LSLEAGEVICPKCKGTAWLTGKNDWDYTCDRCHGARKLDWIEMAMGKPNPRRRLKANWTMEMEKDLVAMYDVNLPGDIIDAMGKELAEKVDEEIVGKMINLSVTKSKLR
jgi:hypothetical protein